MACILHTQNSYVDLEAIWDYIARDDRVAADRLIRRIDEMLKLLVKTPSIGIRQDELRQGLLCKPVMRNYLIFYEIDADDIRILRVLHGARRLEELF
jgi:toxin ParE1/3/4